MVVEKTEHFLVRWRLRWIPKLHNVITHSNSFINSNVIRDTPMSNHSITWKNYSMNTYQPYTYLIGWSVHNLWYYGVRFAKNCHPGDLWVSYFTSSKYVAALREQHGEPDVVQVRKLFSSAQAAVLWEERVLRRTKAMADPKWINRNVAGHWNASQSTPNPLKGKSYAEVYGDKGLDWNNKRLIKHKAWWNTDDGRKRKAILAEQRHPKFTTKGLPPHNKVTDTFDFTCEFCGCQETRRNTKTQRDRKTCGSKSCAAKWTHTYR